ncbi:hypothetical protein L798_14764 [Zootermopsis nevadensis]|uniref:Ionotropic glutamate receptor C-terminal domain-containing protein n=1 Tax=Zootermopsis nevadensis TaxID=136037 RepID=A0A067RIP1_ZOONE|nr:hypothetical protein L798_14764 [Zootermopsis nevadensis]
MAILSYSMMLMIAVPCCGKREVQIPATTAANVISSLKNYFLSGCVFLLSTKHQTEMRPSSVKLGRLLSDKRILATEVSLQSFNHTLPEYRCCSNHPLNVILSGDTQAKSSVRRLSDTTSLTGPTWLLLLDNTSSPKEFLGDSNIPFDCEFLVAQQNAGGLVMLTEVYKIATERPLLYHDFGYWLSETTFRFPSTDFYFRRSSLQGLSISTATIENPPITVLERTDGQIKFSGYFGKVWRVLEKRMEFRTNFSFPADGGRGSVMKNGTATGMIRMIQDNQVHVAVDAFGMSGIRATAVDFTVPLLSTRYCVIVKSPDSLKLQWDNFLAPFSVMLWVAMMATVIVIAIHYTLLYYLGQRYGNQEADEIKFYTFSDSLLLVLGIFCQQGHDTTPRSYSCRFVCISMYIIAVMIFGTYSATFISFLTVHENRLPYTDLESLFSKHAQNYISEPSRQFLDKTYGESYQDNVQPSVLDGMHKVCNSKYSFLMSMDTALAFKNKVNCTVVPLPRETSLYIPQGFAIAKRSPYLGLFNYNLNKLRSNGVLYKHRVYDSMRRTFSKENAAWTRVRLEEVAPIIGFLLAGIVASSVVLLLEKVITTNMFLQQQNVFCCIAAVRYVDGGHSFHPKNSQINFLRPVGHNIRVRRAPQHQRLREVV